MCGGDIKTTNNTYGTCDSCGSTMTLPKAQDDRKANLFNRANHFRRQNEFDKAIQAYENILNDDNSDAEAHWGLVLSRYGIEYVEDPTTHQMVPTCHRVQSESVLKDIDYKETLEYAPDEYTKSLYEEEAKKISDIQKGILAISNKEKPYDVFICYKEATDGGSRTKDSTIAQDIYYELTKDGYSVFFAKITLEDKLGQEYEPYIFSALNSAKVMLVIGTKKEYFEAVWVKNEWSRFLAIMKKDRSRLLIPCYRDMDAYDMPDELSNLQSQDMSKVGFMQDILRGVKKILDAGKADEKAQSTAAHIYNDLFESAEKGTVDAVLFFIETKHADVNAKGEYGGTPLHYAAFNENVEVLKYLVSRSANINAKGNYGDTPLHYAAGYNKNIEVLKYLVSCGANINAKDNYGDTPLHNAASSNKNVEVLRYFVSLGLDIYEKDDHGRTPLHNAACYNQNVEVLKYLVSLGLDVNAKDDIGSTPLHNAACYNENVEVLKYLVSCGLDVNEKDDYGSTPLHEAAQFNENFEVLKYLVSCGANINAKDNFGKTPLDEASDNEDIKRILRDAQQR
jgi:ankyrin repeat protein